MSENTKIKILNNERKFILSPTANLSIILKIKGNISEEELKMAIISVSKKHPLLRARIEFNQDGEAYFVVTQDIIPEMKVNNKIKEDDWMTAIHKEYKVPMNYIKGPLIRIVLLKGADSSDLILYCQHSICDGTAMAYLGKDIMEALGNPNLEFKEVPTARLKSELLGIEDDKEKGLKTKIFNVIIKKLNNKWMKERIRFNYEDYINLCYSVFDRYRLDSILLDFNMEQTRNLIEKCGNYGVTLNSAYTCAFLFAYNSIFHNFKKKSASLAIPYDLRNRLKEEIGETFSLLVGSISFDFKYKQYSESDFWMVTKELHQMITNRMNKYDIFGAAVFLNKVHPEIMDTLSFISNGHLVSSGTETSKKICELMSNKKGIAVKIGNKFKNELPEIIITNLGGLKFKQKYGDLLLDNMIFIPPTSFSLTLVIGAVGVSGKSVVSINYFKDLKEPDEEYENKLLEIKNKVLYLLNK
ncbi:MAG: condensation domain-containing protein [Promethearchaeota archaeon]